MAGDLRDDLVKEMSRRFHRLGERVEQMFPHFFPMAVKTNALTTNTNKTQQFMDWLKEIQQDAGGLNEQGWLDDAIAGAMQRATVQAVGQVRGTRFAKRLHPDNAQAVAGLGNTEGMRRRAELLFTRAYTDLKGITAKMDAQISRTMAEGIMAGKSPYDIARDLRDTVEGMTLPHAKMLARTEITRAHHVATIQSYREMGVIGVEVLAEWVTSGLDNVCEECEALEGRKFTLDAIESLIPLHPNCRCAAVACLDESTEGMEKEA